MLLRSDQQRACCHPTSPGHQRRAHARHHEQPISTESPGIKKPPAWPSPSPLTAVLFWAGKWKSEAVIENLPMAPCSLRRIRSAQPKSPGAKNSQPRRRCRAQGEVRAGCVGSSWHSGLCPCQDLIDLLPPRAAPSAVGAGVLPARLT